MDNRYEEIIKRLELGEPLSKICRDKTMPSLSYPEEKPKEDKEVETIKFTFRTSYLKKNDQKSAYSLITKVLEVPWSEVIKLNGEKKVKVIKDKESIKLPKTAKLEKLKK